LTRSNRPNDCDSSDANTSFAAQTDGDNSSYVGRASNDNFTKQSQTGSTNSAPDLTQVFMQQMLELMQQQTALIREEMRHLRADIVD